jgi:hypothetical protein
MSFREDRAFSSARIELDPTDACPGVWDASRIRQTVGNLISKGIRYGNGDAVRVVLETDGE